MALDRGLPEESILTPVKAKQDDFLEAIAALRPDLCVTAAYGNMLPQAFLDLPKHGTLNIHPSLLPRYRGAAPVNRTLENGDAVTGVSLAFTVHACDAGAVVAQERLALQGDEQAPEVLQTLFEAGSALLVRKLPEVWSGAAEDMAEAQREVDATHAAKMSKAESALDFGLSAQALHNKVRGFAGWPGTIAKIRVSTPGKDDIIQDFKLLKTRLATDEETEMVAMRNAEGCRGDDDSAGDAEAAWEEVVVTKAGVLLPCGDGSVLVATHLQLPGKKACTAADIANGFVDRQAYLAAE